MAPDVGSSVRPMTPRPCMEGVRNEWAVTFETLHCNVEFRIPSKVLCRVGQPGQEKHQHTARNIKYISLLRIHITQL